MKNLNLGYGKLYDILFFKRTANTIVPARPTTDPYAVGVDLFPDFTDLNPADIVANERTAIVGFDKELQIVLKPGGKIWLPTGLYWAPLWPNTNKLALSTQIGALVKSKSSDWNFTGKGKDLAIFEGTLDSGYRSEIKVGIANYTNENKILKYENNGVRVAYGQFIFIGIVRRTYTYGESDKHIRPKEYYFNTTRGTRGFGEASAEGYTLVKKHVKPTEESSISFNTGNI